VVHISVAARAIRIVTLGPTDTEVRKLLPTYTGLLGCKSSRSDADNFIHFHGREPTIIVIDVSVAPGTVLMVHNVGHFRGIHRLGQLVVLEAKATIH